MQSKLLKAFRELLIYCLLGSSQGPVSGGRASPPPTPRVHPLWAEVITRVLPSCCASVCASDRGEGWLVPSRTAVSPKHARISSFLDASGGRRQESPGRPFRMCLFSLSHRILFPFNDLMKSQLFLLFCLVEVGSLAFVRCFYGGIMFLSVQLIFGKTVY